MLHSSLLRLFSQLCLVAILVFQAQATGQRIDWGVEVRPLAHRPKAMIVKVEDMSSSSGQKIAQVQQVTKEAFTKLGYVPFEEQDNIFIHKKDDPNKPTHLIMNLPKTETPNLESLNEFFSTCCVKEGRVQEGHSVLNRHHFEISDFTFYDKFPVIRILTCFDAQGQLSFYEMRDNKNVARDLFYQTNHHSSFIYPSKADLKIEGRPGNALSKLLYGKSIKNDKKSKKTSSSSIVPRSSSKNSDKGKDVSENHNNDESAEEAEEQTVEFDTGPSSAALVPSIAGAAGADQEKGKLKASQSRNLKKSILDKFSGKSGNDSKSTSSRSKKKQSVKFDETEVTAEQPAEEIKSTDNEPKKETQSTNYLELMPKKEGKSDIKKSQKKSDADKK